MMDNAAVAHAEATLEPAVLYQRYSAVVGRWAHRLSGPGVDVKDVVQDVFTRAFEGLPRFRGESKISTWLYQITVNEVRQRRRRERLRRFIPWLDSKAPEKRSSAPDPEEDLIRRSEVARLYRALDGLKEKHREALVLFEIEGLSGEQIAELMDVQLSTVWVWLHRGRKHLLAKLEEQEGAR